MVFSKSEMNSVSGALLSHNKEIMTSTWEAPAMTESFHAYGDPAAQTTKSSANLPCYYD